LWQATLHQNVGIFANNCPVRAVVRIDYSDVDQPLSPATARRLAEVSDDDTVSATPVSKENVGYLVLVSRSSTRLAVAAVVVGVADSVPTPNTGNSSEWPLQPLFKAVCNSLTDGRQH
jgi:hypothetical protein